MFSLTVRKFRWLFLSVLICQSVFFVVFAPQVLGSTTEWNNGEYRFVAGTAPWALGLSLFAGYLYFLLMDMTLEKTGRPLTGVIRRFAAFWLDFMFAMLIASPVIGLVPVLVEWQRKGVFAWDFSRGTPAWTDLFVAPLSIALCFVALMLYYSIPLCRQKPSPGSCIVGYCVLPDGTAPLSMRKALTRSLVGFVAVCGAYLTPFVARDKERGKLWHDRIYGTHAALLE
jgi:hypothetical protein